MLRNSITPTVFFPNPPSLDCLLTSYQRKAGFRRYTIKMNIFQIKYSRVGLDLEQRREINRLEKDDILNLINF